MTFERILKIPPSQIKEIYKLVEEEPIEYGGWFVYTGPGKLQSRKQFKGTRLDVTVPTENYELHWHTHPAYIIDDHSFEQTGIYQPPSVNDIAQSSYKYFSPKFLMGVVLRQVVFTKHAVYIQEPIPEILDKWFKTKDYLIDEKNEKIWLNKWYAPFKKETTKIMRNLHGWGYDYSFRHDDTGETVTLEGDELKEYHDRSTQLEKEYLAVAKKYGVKVTKLKNVSEIKKKGLEIKIKF